jgi:hypothetical protein
MELYLKGQDFESVLPFKIALTFCFCVQRGLIIYSTAFSLQYSLSAMYFMMILSQYSSKPIVTLRINLYSTNLVCFAGFCNTIHFKCEEV